MFKTFGEIQDLSDLAQPILWETGVFCWLYSICLAGQGRKRGRIMGEDFTVQAQTFCTSFCPHSPGQDSVIRHTKLKESFFSMKEEITGFGEYNNVSFYSPKTPSHSFPPNKGLIHPLPTEITQGPIPVTDWSSKSRISRLLSAVALSRPGRTGLTGV